MIEEWAIQRNRQHWAPKNGQSRETGNTGHPRMGNPEKPATLGTQEWAIQRNRQHWAHKTHDQDKQNQKHNIIYASKHK
jgi:hypothetical protein